MFRCWNIGTSEHYRNIIGTLEHFRNKVTVVKIAPKSEHVELLYVYKWKTIHPRQRFQKQHNTQENFYWFPYLDRVSGIVKNYFGKLKTDVNQAHVSLIKEANLEQHSYRGPRCTDSR